MLKLLILVCDALAAALLVWAVNALGLIHFKRARNAHWTERARLLYPARVGAVTTVWLLPANIALGQSLLAWNSMPHWGWVVFAAWLGAVAGNYPFDHEIFPWLRPRAWAHHVVANWLVRFPLWFVLIGIGVAMPQRFDWRAWSLAGLFVLVFVLWCWGGLLWFGRQLGLLIPPTERLTRLVSQTATRVGVPVRGVWLLRSAYSLAFALPYTGDLLFTDRLLARHPDDEISAVCAHEIGHLSEPRLIVLGRVFLNLAWLLPWVFFKPVMHAFEFPGVFVIALLSFAILLGNRGISRRLEKRADKIAHLNEGESGAYARALVRLYEDNLIPAVLARRTRSHPDLYDRLLSLGAQPDFARPKPATSNAVAVFALLFLLALLVGAKLSQSHMY